MDYKTMYLDLVIDTAINLDHYEYYNGRLVGRSMEASKHYIDLIDRLAEDGFTAVELTERIIIRHFPLPEPAKSATMR